MEKIKFILLISLIVTGTTKITPTDTIENGLNKILGKDNLVSGQNNNIQGFNNSVDGFGNHLKSNISTVVGNNNELKGVDTIVSGQSNVILSNKSLVQGNSNIVEKDNNFINGNNNIIRQNVLGPPGVTDNSFIVGNLNKHYLIKNSGSKLLTATKIGSQNNNSINMKGISSASSQNIINNNNIESKNQINLENQKIQSQNNSNSYSSSASQQSSSYSTRSKYSTIESSQNSTKGSISNKQNLLSQQKSKSNIQNKVSVRQLMSKPMPSIQKLNTQKSFTISNNKKSLQQSQKQSKNSKSNAVLLTTKINSINSAPIVQVNNPLDILPPKSIPTTKNNNIQSQSQLKSISSSLDLKNAKTTESTHYKQSNSSQRKIPNIKLSQIANQSNAAINSFVQKTNQLIKTTIPSFVNQTHNTIKKQTQGLKRKIASTRSQFKKSIKEQKQQWKKVHKSYRKGPSKSRKQRQCGLNDQQIYQQYVETPTLTQKHFPVPVQVSMLKEQIPYNSICQCGYQSQNCNCNCNCNCCHHCIC